MTAPILILLYHSVSEGVAPKFKLCSVSPHDFWPSVGSKDNPVWLWLAIDAETRLVADCAIGPRDKETADELWNSLPPDYRQWAVCYTDFLKAYASVLPSKHHQAVGKSSEKPSRIERLNNAICQRCSRLVRKALSFSKKLANYLGAIWYFIYAYNAHRLARLSLITTCA